LRIGAFNQALGASQIVDLPCREHQIGRISQGVDEGVNFGRNMENKRKPPSVS
jgi:hypothetical protein